MKFTAMRRAALIFAGAIAVVEVWPAPIRTRAAEARRLGEFQSRSATLDVWLTAGHGHQPGQLDEGIRTVARWPAPLLDDLLRELKARLRIRGDTPLASYGAIDSASQNTLVKRMAVFHADLAMLHRRPHGYEVPTATAGALAVDDGQRLGAGNVTVHWRLARGILDLVEPDPRSDRDVRDWYQATAAWLQHWREYSELGVHLAYAREIFPDDAIFALYLGTMHEAFAEPRIQRTIMLRSPSAGSGRFQRTAEGWDSSAMPTTPPVHPVDTPAGERHQAETLFRQALRRDPALHEARLRLARVLAVRGRYLEAVREFEKLVAEALPRPLEYHARLFLGQALHVLGRGPEAARALTRAAELYPEAQSPRLALSQLARDEGDRRRAADALTVLRRRPSPDAAGDPWHEYHHAHEPRAQYLVGQLRARWSR